MYAQKTDSYGLIININYSIRFLHLSQRHQPAEKMKINTNPTNLNHGGTVSYKTTLYQTGKENANYKNTFIKTDINLEIKLQRGKLSCITI